MITPAAAYSQGPGAAALMSRYPGVVAGLGRAEDGSQLGPCAHCPLSIHPRLCAVKTTYTAAQLGISVTQRRVPVNRKPASCPGGSRPQPTSACQATKPWRVTSPVIMSPAAPPPIPAVDSCLERGAAVPSQRCMGSGVALGGQCLGLGRWPDSLPCSSALCLAHSGTPALRSHAQLEELSRRQWAKGSVCHPTQYSSLDHSFCPLLPARVSAAWTTSIAALTVIHAWLRGSVRGGTRRWLDWRRCLPTRLPCPNPKTWVVTSTPAAQWGRPAAQA